VHGVNSDLDYIDHLARESARFAEAVGAAAPDAAVPTCPDWDADDLLWHLGEVQWFWGTIVRENATSQQAEELKPGRPADRAGLQDFYKRATSALHEVLAANAPETPAWTWSDDQTVGFIRRRQAHEALIHRIDAELTAGQHTTPLDPQLSADGVDEALRVIYAGVPEWGTFTPHAGQTVRLRATDTGDSWLVTLGRFTGTDPSGTSYDEPDIDASRTDPGTAAAAEISGSAPDLDCWLWHRPTTGPIERSGDPEVLSRFESTIAPGIN
jgi:uncharacterized protein (TIGR03083 family)